MPGDHEERANHAMRKACDAFFATYVYELGAGAPERDVLLRALSKTAHVHESMLVLASSHEVMRVRVSLEFGAAVSREEFQAIVDAATRSPGKGPL